MKIHRYYLFQGNLADCRALGVGTGEEGRKEGWTDGHTTSFGTRADADEGSRLQAPIGGTELNCNSVHAAHGGNLN